MKIMNQHLKGWHTTLLHIESKIEIIKAKNCNTKWKKLKITEKFEVKFLNKIEIVQTIKESLKCVIIKSPWTGLKSGTELPLKNLVNKTCRWNL